MSYQSVKVLYP